LTFTGKTVTGGTYKNITVNQTADGDTALTGKRATDTSPTGNFLLFQNNAADTNLFRLTVGGVVNVGQWQATAIGAQYGGTGGDSSGSTGIAHVSGGSWSYSSIVNGDVSNSAAITYSKLNLSASIVNADISGTAAIANSKLANSSVTINGTSNQVNVSSSSVSLGGSTTLSLPQSIDTAAAVQFGTVQLGSLANSPASNWVIAGRQSANNRPTLVLQRQTNTSPTGDFISLYDAAATPAKLFNVDITGTVTTGTWNGSAIANAYLANSSLTIGSTSVSLGGTAATVSGLTLSSPTITGTATLANSATIANASSGVVDIGGASSLYLENNQAIGFKDSGGTRRNVLSVDSGNNVTVAGLASANVLAIPGTSGAVRIRDNAQSVNVVEVLASGALNLNTPASTDMTFTPGSGAKVSIAGDATVTGILKAGSGPTTLTDSAGKILSAALNTVAVANGGTGKTAISALSIWAANSANTLVEVTPAAGQSVRINAGGTAWEAYTPGGASINATDTVIPYRSNSTTFADSQLIRVSSSLTDVRNSTTAQNFDVYKTYTSSSSFEKLTVTAAGAGALSQYGFGFYVGSSGGTPQDVWIWGGTGQTGRSNLAGGNLVLVGGGSTGNAAGGLIYFGLTPAGSSGTSLNTHALYGSWQTDGLHVGSSSATNGNLVFENSTNTNKITFSLPTPGGNRTINVPDAGGTIAVSATSPITLSGAGAIGVTSANLVGTSNQVNLSASGTGVLLGSTNITLSLPQNYDTAATPQLGRLGLGVAADSVTPMKNNGATLSTDADGTVAGAIFLGTINPPTNNTNTRTYPVVQIKPTLNSNTGVTNKTVDILQVDSVNTNTTGLTVNLLDLMYGGTSQFTVNSSGQVSAGTWQGGVISSTYGGTGVNNAGRTLTINTNSGTLAFGAASKTLTINNSIAISGTDSTTMTFPSSSDTVGGLATAQTWTAVNTYTPGARSSGTAAYFTINAPADTSLTAGSEAIGINFAGATRQHASNTNITTQREVVFSAPTYSAASATSTITSAATVAIAGAPTAGTNVAITNAYAFWVQGGQTRLNGALIPSASAALTDASTIATDASLGNFFTVTLGGNRTLGNPTNSTDQQRVLWQIVQDGTGSRTLAFGTNFKFGSEITGCTISSTASSVSYITAIYNSSQTKWHVVSCNTGF
jgi:hypothetical protein